MKLRVTIIYIVLILLSGVTAVRAQDIKPIHDSTARRILAELYYATDGQNWVCDSNWLSDKPLGEWHGVSAYGSDSMYNEVNLDLSSNNLHGTLPASLGVAPLDWVDLSENKLYGAIPRTLVRGIHFIDLHDNQLTDTISLSELHSLNFFNFEGNQIRALYLSEVPYGGLAWVLLFGFAGGALILISSFPLYFRLKRGKSLWPFVYVDLAFLVFVAATIVFRKYGWDAMGAYAAFFVVVQMLVAGLTYGIFVACKKNM